MPDWLKDALVYFGGVAALAIPVGIACARSLVHKHVGDAPAMIRLTDRVTATERRVDEHAEDVKHIPRLVVVLEGMERAVAGLNDTLQRAGLAKLLGGGGHA